METIIFYLIVFFVYMALTTREKMKRANQQVESRKPNVQKDTPESFLSRVKGLIEDEVMGLELMEEINEYRRVKTDPDANINHGHQHIQPEETRDDRIMREQLKEFRHSESAGIARLEREDLHRDFDFANYTTPTEFKPEPVKVEVLEESNNPLGLFADQDEVLKALIYSEILDKPKSLR
ncbi:MAG: hypothetical protein GX074_05685 [Erysipelothrix sp.]|nr:hypothetical protein [Erysipelothrix sp.]